MLILLLFGQIISSRPPLSPEEAVAVLRSSHSIADRTNVPVVPTPSTSYDWSRDSRGVFVLRSSPNDGPYGPFPPYPEPINKPGWTTTFYVGPSYPYRHYQQNARPPIIHQPSSVINGVAR